MSRIIRASQIRQEDKLRELFSEQMENMQAQETEIVLASQEVGLAQKEASAILEQARVQAEQFLTHAQNEVEKAMEQGFVEGYNKGVEEGFQAGMEQLIQEMGKLFQNFEREMEHAQMVMQSQVQGLAPKMVRLAVQIAERIVRREVVLDPNMIVRQVEHILHEISRVKSLAIRVHPSDLEIVKSYEERFLQLTQGIDEIDFVIDYSLEPGGCIIETDSGGVDATIETQLEMILATLLEGSRDAHD